MMVALYLTGISNVLSGKAVSESSMCYDDRKDLIKRNIDEDSDRSHVGYG